VFVLPAWATVTIAVGASAITALSAFFGSLAARGDKGAWRNTQLETAHTFATAIDRALRDIGRATLHVSGDQVVLQESLSRTEQHLDAVADAHTDVLLVYGSGNRGEIATHAYETLRAAADALGESAPRPLGASAGNGLEAESLNNIQTALDESRARLDEFISHAARSIRGRRPLRLVPNFLLDAVSHDAGIRRKTTDAAER
jgi:hypothetical protein